MSEKVESEKMQSEPIMKKKSYKDDYDQEPEEEEFKME